MFGGDMEIPEQLKEIIRHSSEAEVVEIVLMSLKEAIKDPDAFAKAGNIPPMLANGLKMLPKTDAALRPMAKSMAQMLIKQVKSGGGTPSFEDMQESMGDASSWMSSFMGGADPTAPPPSIPDNVTRLIEQSIECKKREDFVQAEEILKEALDLCPIESAATCQVLNNLATTQLILDKYDAAEANLKQFLKLSEKHLSPDDHHIASSYFGLAMVREAQNKTADADLLYKKALSIAEKSYVNAPLELAHMLETLANFYEGQKLWRKADPLFQRAFQLRENALGAEDLEVAEQYVRYALIHESREHFAEAEMFCYKSLQIKYKLLKQDDPDLARNQALLASIYIGQQEFAKAEPIIKQSIDVIEKSDADELVYPLEIYARLLNATSREDEAKEVSERVAALSAEE
ncbi:MAG: tetratricopeptide repeat protein [Candidatus Melainabacteria bacterium]|nr:tetratricopeptide repeat protein [Candidatus Melainabacteria bacterium]